MADSSLRNSTTKSKAERKCSIPGCERKLLAKGYCGTHYARLRSNGTTELKPKPAKQSCKVEGCKRPYCARGYCNTHYARIRANGTLELQPKPTKEICEVEGCQAGVYAKGLCPIHYHRLRNTGTTNSIREQTRIKYETVFNLWSEGKSSEEITKLTGFTRQWIWGILRKNPRYRRFLGFQWPPVICERIISLFDTEKRVIRVAEIMRLDPSSVARVLNHYHICRYPKLNDHFLGEGNPRWNGGMVTRNGYRYVKQPNHPSTTKQGYVYEHRLVMEERIGRYLTPEETVHHKNGNRMDNRIENLELWSKRHGPGQRVADKIEYALQILADYHPEYLTKRGLDAKGKPIQNQLF